MSDQESVIDPSGSARWMCWRFSVAVVQYSVEKLTLFPNKVFGLLFSVFVGHTVV